MTGVQTCALPISSSGSKDFSNQNTINEEKTTPVQENEQEGESVKMETTICFELQKQKFTVGKEEVSMRLKYTSLKSVKKEDLVGPYILSYTSYFNQDVGAIYRNAQFATDDEGNIIISGFAGLSYDIKASYDENTGTFAIPAQFIYAHNTYGDVHICPFNAAEGKYILDGIVYGTVGEDGNLSLNDWGLFVVGGDFNGSCFDIGLHSTMLKPNATIKTVQETEGVEYPSYAKQISKNELLVTNIAGNGRQIIVDLYPDKSVSITPQYIYTNAFYGEFYCYPANWEKSSGAQSGDIEGLGDKNTMKFGNWGVFARLATYLNAYKALSTEIILDFDIIYPDVIENPFEGSGTSSSPYMIKTAEDLQYMSQAVRSGELYKGKYFNLGNDIDFSTYESRLRKIGISAEKAFEGTLDGKGFKISNLSISGGDDYNGLFGVIGENGVVKNLIINNLDINCTGSQVGGIAGRMLGKLENCHVSGTIIAKNNSSGGLAGCSLGEIENCTFNGSITGYGEVGGIVGFNLGKINKCSANGVFNIPSVLISGRRSLGGIVGTTSSIEPNFSEINDCYVSGSLNDTSKAGAVGGIVGVSSRGIMNRCFNVAEIYTETDDEGYSGGILASAHHTFVTDCYNSGSIIGIAKQTYVGGIVGRVSKSTIYSGNNVTVIGSEFKNCYSVGIVKNASVFYENNLYGDVYEIDIFENCYYDYQVTGARKQAGAKSTKEMFTAEGMPGFNTSVWNFKEGYYPSLKNLDDNAAAKLSIAPMILADGDFMSNIKSNFKVTNGDGVVWMIYNNGNFTNETSGLKLENDDAMLGNMYSSQLLCAISAEANTVRSHYISIVPKRFEGDGTETSPFLIKTKEDLFILDEAIAVYKQEHVGDHFLMTNDIDMADVTDFYGIGAATTSYSFGGTFDGGGFSIHNLKIKSTDLDNSGTATASNSISFVGFFGTATEYSEIKNLIIAKDCEFDVWSFSGSIVGGTFGKVTNCKNYASMTGLYSYIGGICGVLYDDGSITDCYNSGSITCGGQNVGGIAGASRSMIERCQNDGVITGKYLSVALKEGSQNNVGGIVGLNYGDITDCSNNGAITAYSIVAGIAGCNSTSVARGSLINNINTGLITCINDVLTRGAIVGQMLSSNIVKGNVYDSQITTYGGSNNAKKEGVTSMSTADLVKGEIIDGFNKDIWAFDAQAYPVLAQFKNEEMAIAAKGTFVCFGTNEYRTNVRTDATLSNNESLSWTLAKNDDFKIDGSILTVIKPTEMNVINDTLIAVYGSYYKSIPLASIPDILKGGGSEDDPFLIETTEDMSKLAEFIETSKVDYNGNHFRLENDLDYTDKEYMVIASGTLKFQGTFDGNNKKIINLNFSAIETANKYLGLFGTIGESGTLKNLTFESGVFEGHSYVGGMVAKLYGRIENCINKAEIKTAKGSYAGGIACIGYESSAIINCANHGRIYTSSSYAGGIASDMKENTLIENCFNTGIIAPNSSNGGGITYRSFGVINNCYNEVSYDGKTGFGGITSVGRFIYNCYNKGNIISTGSGAGIAISINSAAGIVMNCYNTGDVSGAGSVSGIISTVAAGNTISDCYNLGDIYSSKANIGGAFGTINGATANPTTITNCYNAGKVTGIGNYFGGFAYRINAGATAINCANYGDVDVEGTYIGGVAASVAGTIENCFNVGDITTTNYAVGGLSGLAAGTADKCFNLGTVKAGGAGNESARFGNAGGLWGYGKPTLSNCFNLGTVIGPDCLGGLNGMSYSDMYTDNCFVSCEIITTSTANKIGHISTLSADTNTPTYTNVFYNNEINGQVFSYDIPMLGTGLTSKELADLDLGSEFINLAATYPVLADFEDHKLANFYLATLVLSGEDQLSDITEPFLLGTPANVEWEATDNLSINGNVVTPIGLGEATLTKKIDDRQKVYNLIVSKTTTGVEDNIMDKTCIETLYYDVNGIRVNEPQKPGLYIIQYLYDDGSKAVKKVIIK